MKTRKENDKERTKSKEDLRTEVMSEGEYRTVFENKKFLKKFNR